MKKTRPQCGIIIENAQGEILLQLRDNIPSILYPNRWGTFGGQVDTGETPHQAIVRETKEELDYDLKDPEFFGNYPCDGYDIYMFRQVDKNISLRDLTVREGRMGKFFSTKAFKKIPCAFNCREIVEDYFKKFPHKR